MEVESTNFVVDFTDVLWGEVETGLVVLLDEINNPKKKKN